MIEKGWSYDFRHVEGQKSSNFGANLASEVDLYFHFHLSYEEVMTTTPPLRKSIIPQAASEAQSPRPEAKKTLAGSNSSFSLDQGEHLVGQSLISGGAFLIDHRFKLRAGEILEANPLTSSPKSNKPSPS